MKSSFSAKFNSLRKERKLSVRDISLMTGVPLREVKKWDKGSSLPNDSRVMKALEGLLGEDITRDFSTIDKEVIQKERIDQNLFSLDDSIFKERRNVFGKLKEKIFPNTRTQERKQPTDYIKVEPFEEVPTEAQVNQALIIESSEEDLLIEYPYINDPHQIVTYWKRNAKTFMVLVFILVIGMRSLSMFWETLTLFINNLI